MTQQATPGVIASPFTDPVSWMSITVGGSTVGPADASGYVEVKKARRPYKWQKKDAPGQTGATQTFLGTKPPDFELLFYLWTDFHFQIWQNVSQFAFVYDASKKTVDPTDIYHPALQMVGISQCIVDEIGAPEQQGKRLLWVATVKVSEYSPPLVANVAQTPTGATTTADQNGWHTVKPVAADVAALQASIAAQQHVNDTEYP